MKTLNICLTLFLSILLTSCGNDDNENNSETPNNIEITEANIVGKWLLIARTENGNSITLDECESTNNDEYFANNTLQVTFSLQNDSTPVECIESSFSSPWSLNGNIISYDTGDSDGTVLELTETTLKLKFYSIDDNQNIERVQTYSKI